MNTLLGIMEYAAVIMTGAILGLLGLGVVIGLLFIIGFLCRELYACIKEGGRR